METLSLVSVLASTGSLRNLQCTLKGTLPLAKENPSYKLHRIGHGFCKQSPLGHWRPSAPPSGQIVLGLGGWVVGKVKGKGCSERRLFVRPIYRLLGFNIKPAFVYVFREPVVRRHTNARGGSQEQARPLPQGRDC